MKGLYGGCNITIYHHQPPTTPADSALIDDDDATVTINYFVILLSVTSVHTGTKVSKRWFPQY